MSAEQYVSHLSLEEGTIMVQPEIKVNASTSFSSKFFSTITMVGTDIGGGPVYDIAEAFITKLNATVDSIDARRVQKLCDDNYVIEVVYFDLVSARRQVGAVWLCVEDLCKELNGIDISPHERIQITMM